MKWSQFADACEGAKPKRCLKMREKCVGHPCILKSIYRSDLTAKLGIFLYPCLFLGGFVVHQTLDAVKDDTFTCQTRVR